MKYKIAWLLLGIFLKLQTVQAQQDVQFSQYIFNNLSINPAYAGYKGDWYLQGQYRNQWTGFPGAPTSGGLSADGLLNAYNDNMGIGGQIMWDKLGPQESISIYGNYAYRIQLDANDTRRLCLGIGIGATQYSLDGSKLEVIRPQDPILPSGKTSVWKPDARFGIYYYTPKWYAGISALDLFSINQDQKFYYSSGHEYVTLKRAPHLYLTAGTVFNLSDQVKLLPSFLWKEDFKGPNNVDLNVFAAFAERLWVGASYRTSMKLGKNNLQDGLTETTAASALLQYFITSNFRLGYSYDIATNGLAGYQGGSHEISIGVTLPRNNSRLAAPRYF